MITIVLLGCTSPPSREVEAEPPPPPSPYAAKVLDFLRGHDLAALTWAWPARSQPPEPPEPPETTGRWAIAADGPRYHLMIDPITHQFWI